MAKTMNENVMDSISSIYGSFIKKREDLKREKEERKLAKQDAELNEIETAEEEPKLSKKEKREKAFDKWKSVIGELTGEDIDYEKPKSNKKKYRKWLDDEFPMEEKPKKKKKRNYNKEFAPELSMLKNIVSEQNKFNADLQRRYNNAAGPNTKDAMPLNKTLVELASVLNAGRSNSLSVLREIGSLKKNISDLYMKQAKLDADLGKGEITETDDLALLGSNIMNNTVDSVFAMTPDISPNPLQMQPSPISQVASPIQNVASPIQPTSSPVQPISSFDPSTWGGNSNIDVSATTFEAIPHKIVVEYRESDAQARFKAIKESDSTELQGCPVPTCSIKTIDTKNKMAKDEFDQVYHLEII